MRRRWSKIAKRIVGALICYAFILLGTGVSSASTKAPPDSPEAMLAYIESAPGAWYEGILHYLSKRSLTLSDVNHWFVENPLFVSKYGHKVSRGFFSKGDMVKILLNREGKCVIVVRL